MDVLPVNDKPIARNDTLRVQRNELGSINVLDNDFDIEDDVLSLSTTPVVSPANGNVSLSTDGTIEYQSDLTFRGTDFLEYQIVDSGSPNETATGLLVIIIGDENFKVYQGVSPNNDGANDYWHIDGIDYYPRNSVKVFDRYNNLVYEVNGYNNRDKSWRGQANRGPRRDKLPEGTYFYFIDLGVGDDGSSGSYKGFVVLKND